MLGSKMGHKKAFGWNDSRRNIRTQMSKKKMKTFVHGMSPANARFCWTRLHPRIPDAISWNLFCVRNYLFKIKWFIYEYAAIFDACVQRVIDLSLGLATHARACSSREREKERSRDRAPTTIIQRRHRCAMYIVHIYSPFGMEIISANTSGHRHII